MLDRLFKLSENNTNVRTELVAGLTTFLTMAYIIFVNPAILAEAKMPFGAVFAATCVAAAVGCFLMAFLANYPIALAPGMGLNAYFAFGVVGGMGHSWQVALGCVFISGVIFLIISVLPIREWIVNAIPKSLKMAIAAGIGLFLALIALKNAGIVVAHPATLVTHGKLDQLAGLHGGTGLRPDRRPRISPHHGRRDHRHPGRHRDLDPGGPSEVRRHLRRTPPSIAPVFLQMDLAGALQVGLVTVVFAFLFVDLFDNTGTLIATGPSWRLHAARRNRAPAARCPDLRQCRGGMIGAAVGTSTTTSYIESASGINAGGRTGLTAAAVGVLFLLALFVAPLAGSIPAYATAPALLYVACLMARGLTEIEWNDHH
jgi:AGZA family xanthine/uracil permease-like MFS transporter